MSDQENVVKNLVDLVRESRPHETAVINHTERVECQCRRNRASELRGRETDQEIAIAVRGELRRECGAGPQVVPISGAALCVADHALSGDVRWEETPFERHSRTTVPRTGGRVC